MSGDIVERLREAHQTVPIPAIASLYSNAADEIERLRAAREHTEQGIDKMLTEVKRLRAALQLIVDQLEEGFPKSAQQFAMDALGKHLKEARRGNR